MKEIMVEEAKELGVFKFLKFVTNEIKLYEEDEPDEPMFGVLSGGTIWLNNNSLSIKEGYNKFFDVVVRSVDRIKLMKLMKALSFEIKVDPFGTN